jgi:hypothetical protein
MFFDGPPSFDEVLEAVGESEEDSIGHEFLGRRNKE